MIQHYLKIAFRNLWKYKVQNLIGIIGLAVGFICFSLCTYMAQQYFTQDTEYPDAKRIYTLSTKYSSVYNGNLYTAFDDFPEVEKLTIMENQRGNVMYFKDEKLPPSISVFLMQVDTCFFDFFSLKIVAGNPYSINHSANSILLFDDKARELSENINELIGQTVKFFNDETEHQITGIVKKPENSYVMLSYFSTGFILNKTPGHLQQNIQGQWDPHEIRYTFLKLRPKTNLRNFEERLQKTDFGFTIEQDRLGYLVGENGEWIRNKADGKEHFTLKLLRKAGHEDRTTYFRIGVFVVGLLIFLMTLFNYISFQTALFYNRLKECAIRKTNGSGKLQLFFLFFSEIFIAFLFAFLIAFLLEQLFFPQLMSLDIFNEFQPQLLRTYMFQYLLIVLSLSALFCLVPTYTLDKLSIRTVFLGLSIKGKKTVGRDMLLFILEKTLFFCRFSKKYYICPRKANKNAYMNRFYFTYSFFYFYFSRKVRQDFV